MIEEEPVKQTKTLAQAADELYEAVTGNKPNNPGEVLVWLGQADPLK